MYFDDQFNMLALPPDSNELINDSLDIGKEVSNNKTDIVASLSLNNEESENCFDVETVNDKSVVFATEVTIPEVGMRFNTVEEVFQCFKNYAKHMGFPARKRSSKRDEDGNLRYITFACGRCGKPDCISGNPLMPQPTNKIGCKVKLTSSLGEDGKWRINKLFLDHNHDLSPTKSRFFRCYRKIDEHVKRQLEVCDIAGIGPKKSFNALVVEAGGHENLSFIEKDCRNYLDKARQLRLGEGDAVAIQNYFLNMQAQNSNFFFSMDLDNDGRLKNVFWADERSREAYKEFGDVVTFDTTYLTNKYDMPFAPFVGVNHHGQSILLGCGLLSSETTETFLWLFRTWLACMSDVAPTGIITDQDRAMKKAIEIAFPNTRHRLCLWHVMKKLPEKFGSHGFYESIKTTLQNVVYDTQDSKEFEKSWKIMLDKFDLHDNIWLSELYKERHHWVPCFVTSNFWAGMSTTQRSESINAFFDGYVNAKTTLKQFVEQYNHALKAKIEKESQADFKSFSQSIRCATTYDIEKQFQSVYTLKKFKEFQIELTAKLYCDITETREGFMGTEFDIYEDVAVENYRKLLSFTVLFKKENCKISCSCRKFEFKGILCRHALLVLTKNNVTTIPNRYILDRWRKDVLRSHTRIRLNYDGAPATSAQLRYKEMCNEFSKVADLVADDEVSFSHVMEWIDSKKSEFFLQKRNASLTCKTGLNKDECGRIRDCSKVQDPIRKKTKRRTRTNRFKSSVEKKMKSSRRMTLNSKDTQPAVNDRLLVVPKSKKKKMQDINTSTFDNAEHDSRNFLQQLEVPSKSEAVSKSAGSMEQNLYLPPIYQMTTMNPAWGYGQHLNSLYGQHHVMEPYPSFRSSFCPIDSSTISPHLSYEMQPSSASLVQYLHPGPGHTIGYYEPNGHG